MSNGFTSPPKVFSSVSSTQSHSRLNSAGTEREAFLQPRGHGPRTGSFSSVISGPGPGSFNTALRTVAPSIHHSGPGGGGGGGDDDSSNSSAPGTPEKRLEELTQQLNREIKFKEGAENMLQALDSKKPKEAKNARLKTELELNAVNHKIAQIKTEMDALKRPKENPLPSKATIDQFLTTSNTRPLSVASAIGEMLESLGVDSSESPTFTLSEILQCLEEKGRKPEFYVEKANSLVILLKKHPMLKYDLVWSQFGQRVQAMLLHENREVVAAGYRITRYAITDIGSLRTIRQLQTDFLTICSLAKDPKNTVEREQALKFVRAFIEVKGGIKEISRGVVRAIVSCAEQESDRLRGIALETLAELSKIHPPRSCFPISTDKG